MSFNLKYDAEQVMIDFRTYILDVIFGTIGKPVLNAVECGGRETEDIPGLISECVLAFKQTATINDQGVDYAELRISELYRNYQQTTAACLRDFDPADLITQEEKLAFWINLYNLLVIDAVLQYSVQNSVTEGWFGLISFFRRAAYMIGGFRYSLEDIEHGILRANRGLPFFLGKQFAEDDPRLENAVWNFDARIHFALNCASRSCPPIANYTSNEINRQLDLASTNFLAGDTFLGESGKSLWISRIFKWYSRDFGGKAGVIEMLRSYLPEADPRRELLENSGSNVIRYSPYDWHLNGLA